MNSVSRFNPFPILVRAEAPGRPLLLVQQTWVRIAVELRVLLSRQTGEGLKEEFKPRRFPMELRIADRRVYAFTGDGQKLWEASVEWGVYTAMTVGRHHGEFALFGGASRPG
ncbi:MAG: hypothetical protein ACC645_22690 [Pirellulales bacterium]